MVTLIASLVAGYLLLGQLGRVSLLSTLKASHADILDSIRSTKDLTDDTAKKLKAATDAFAKSFA